MIYKIQTSVQKTFLSLDNFSGKPKGGFPYKYTTHISTILIMFNKTLEEREYIRRTLLISINIQTQSFKLHFQ